MNINIALQPATHLPADYRGAEGRILEVQCQDGAIPWYKNGPWDPWNHCECAMALAVTGQVGAAKTGIFLSRGNAKD